MNNYQAVVFDLGKTLIYSPRVKPFQMLAKKFGAELEQSEISMAYSFADHYFMKNYPGVLGKKPEEFYEIYLSIIFSYLHLDLSVKEFYDELFRTYPPRKEWVPYPETIDTLSQIKKRGLKLGVISNWDLSARGLLRKIGIHDWFDDIVISSEVGVEKPAPEIFIRSINNLCVEPEKMLYVGDNYYDDVIGANSVGIKTLIINRSVNQYKYGEGDYEVICTLTDVLKYISKQESKGA